MWGQVTRSGQVTQLQNNFPIAPRLQCFRESYETFVIWWGHQCLQNVYLGFLISVTSGQVIFRPPHFKSMGKKSTPLYLLWRKPIWVESYRIGQLWTFRAKSCIAYPSKGHLRSPEVTNCHLSITFDPKQIETWDLCQYVRLGLANRLICNMTHFGYHVTLAWLDLRSNFDLDLSKSFYIWFDAPERDKHYGIKFVALTLKLKFLSSKNRFENFWNFDPWWPQLWPEPKNDRNDFEIIFSELSNAAFRFSLRRPGAEIMGGVKPPPQQGVENSEAQQGAV